VPEHISALESWIAEVGGNNIPEILYGLSVVGEANHFALLNSLLRKLPPEASSLPTIVFFSDSYMF